MKQEKVSVFLDEESAKSEAVDLAVTILVAFNGLKEDENNREFSDAELTQKALNNVLISKNYPKRDRDLLLKVDDLFFDSTAKNSSALIKYGLTNFERILEQHKFECEQARLKEQKEQESSKREKEDYVLKQQVAAVIQEYKRRNPRNVEEDVADTQQTSHQAAPGSE